MVELIIKSFGIDHFFCGVTGGDSVAYNKPDGRHILATLKLMNVVGLNSIMIGDTDNDIIAAHDAGIKAVAVKYGYSQQSRILFADKVIGNLMELVEGA